MSTVLIAIAERQDHFRRPIHTDNLVNFKWKFPIVSIQSTFPVCIHRFTRIVWSAEFSFDKRETKSLEITRWRNRIGNLVFSQKPNGVIGKLTSFSLNVKTHIFCCVLVSAWSNSFPHTHTHTHKPKHIYGPLNCLLPGSKIGNETEWARSLHVQLFNHNGPNNIGSVY